MKLSDYMSTRLETVERTTSVRVAIKKMEERKIRHLLVMEGHALAGIISRRELDVLSMVASFEPDRATVELAMTADPFRVDLSTPLAMVATSMAEARIGSVVVTQDDRPVGIFTTVDALRALADAVRHTD